MDRIDICLRARICVCAGTPRAVHTESTLHPASNPSDQVERDFALVRHSSNVFRLWCDDGAGVLAGFEADSDVTYTDTEWHHVAGVIDDGTSILYVDGVRQAKEGNVDMTDSGTYAQIGKQYSDESSHRYWNGLVDDVRIYYRALSEQEISGL